MNELFEALRQFLYGLPEAVAWIVCLVLALTRMERHPTVSKLASTAACVSLGGWIVFSIVRVLMMRKLRDGSIDSAMVQGMYMAIGGLQTVIQAGALGLLIAAAFGWRQTNAR